MDVEIRKATLKDLDIIQDLNLMLFQKEYEEYDKNLESFDILEFKGPKTYPQKLKEDQKKTGLKG